MLKGESFSIVRDFSFLSLSFQSNIPKLLFLFYGIWKPALKQFKKLFPRHNSIRVFPVGFRTKKVFLSKDRLVS